MLTNTDTEDLLIKLQWPEKHLEEKGRVSWTRLGENESTDAAFVLVSPTHIRARFARLHLSGPDLTQQMEAVWAIGQNQTPKLTFFCYAGENQELNEKKAVQCFNEMLEILNSRPAFQTMGIRWKDSLIEKKTTKTSISEVITEKSKTNPHTQ